MPGELEIVAALAARFASADPDVLVGIGDDAAVLRVAGPLVVSTDTTVEGVHVDLAVSSPADAGFRAVTTALSDLAAMGAQARWALPAAVIPARLVDAADEIAAGMDQAAREARVALVGGDTSAGEMLAITVTVLGIAERPVRRGGAHAGDLLCVTGDLGAAACGIALARAHASDAAAADVLTRFPVLLERHRRPRARLREGLALAAAGAHAMIDLSDGLATDAAHVAAASGLAALIEHERLPLADGVAEAARALGLAEHAIAVAGGEDYELAVALAPADVEACRAAVAPTPLTVVGHLQEGAPGDVRWTGPGELPRGWEHFA